MQEYAGAGNRASSSTLLAPVQRGAEQSPLVRELVESQRVFQPQTWTARDAHRFLCDVALCEDRGLLARIPDRGKAGRPSRPTVNVTVGAEKAAGLDTLLDFNVALTPVGEAVTEEEWARIAAADAGLGLLKGKWVEGDMAKLEGLLAHCKMLERGRRDGGGERGGARVFAGEGGRLARNARGTKSRHRQRCPGGRAWGGVNTSPIRLICLEAGACWQAIQDVVSR